VSENNNDSVRIIQIIDLAYKTRRFGTLQHLIPPDVAGRVRDFSKTTTKREREVQPGTKEALDLQVLMHTPYGIL
jgi:hypothetical protein